MKLDRKICRMKRENLEMDRLGMFYLGQSWSPVQKSLTRTFLRSTLLKTTICQSRKMIFLTITTLIHPQSTMITIGFNSQSKRLPFFQGNLSQLSHILSGKTFYLQIQYTIVYQYPSNQSISHSLTNNKHSQQTNKNLMGNKINQNQHQNPNFKEVKNVKSKLVHGFILQNQGKHLILSLKSKAPHFLKNQQTSNQNLQTPVLTELQFTLIRVYQTSKQNKILCQQTIQNPSINNEYSIDFLDEKVDQNQKQKSIGTIIFELFSAIVQEPLAKKVHQEEKSQKADDFEYQSEIPEDISQNKNSARLGYENYTLGVPQYNQNDNKSRNIFDNNSQDDMSQSETNTQQEGPKDQFNKRQNHNSQLSSTNENVLVFKLNQHSKLIDDNLSKSKMDDSQQRQYNAEATQSIDESKINNITSKSKSKELQIVSKNSRNETKSLKMKSKQIAISPNQYTFVQDGQPSRYQGNITDQREHYMSTLQYSKYVNQEIVLKGSPQISPILPSTPSNQLKKTSQNKVIQVESSKTPIFESNKKDKSQKLDKTLSTTNKNAKRQNQPTPYSQRTQKDDQAISQDNSQLILQNWPDMDSSNIRFKFDQNDISNIQETKNMQELINEIEKIEKQWYQKRVLNKKFKENQQKLRNDNIKLPENKLEKNMRTQSKEEDQDKVIDLELRKFKIKLNQGTFYNKLIENLKNKHIAQKSLQNANEKNHLQSDIKNSKRQQIIKTPKDYTVSMIAHELDEYSMANETFEKMQIKIPSKQVQDLIQAQMTLLKQNSQTKSNQKNQTESIRNQIIKDFERQLYSKVLKIKIGKTQKHDERQDQILQKEPQDKKILQSPQQKSEKQNDRQKQKSKAKIIEISLQEEFPSLNLLQVDVQDKNFANSDKKLKKDGKSSKMVNNRISLIGMYPLPLLNTQNKAQEAYFYQNLSSEPLSIAMYNMKTGNQQGKLSFQLKKGKKDKQIQTFESLDDDSSPTDLSQKQFSSQINNKRNEFKTNQAQNIFMKKPGTLLQSLKQNSKDIKAKGLKVQLKIEGNTQIAMKEKVSKSKEKQAYPGKIIKQNLTAEQSKIANPSIQCLKIDNPTQDGLMIDIDQNLVIQKLNAIEVALPNSQRLLSINNLSPEERQFKTPTQIGNINDKVKKVNSRAKTDNIVTHFSKGPMKYGDQQSSSYKLMKQELLETAGLLENLKLKAQDFLNKVSREKRSQNSNSKNEEQKQSRNQYAKNSNNEILASEHDNFDVRSSVISEIMLSKQNKKPNIINLKTNIDSQYSGESFEMTKKNSPKSKIVREKLKKSFQLRQAGDYHFDNQQINLPIGLESQQKGYSHVREKSLLYHNQGLISIELFSMKIKFLSLNNFPVKRKSRNSQNSSFEYFVLIYSDCDQHQTDGNFDQLPCIQKCYKPPELTDDNLYVEFSLKRSNNNDNDGSISLSGKQSSRIFIQLYNSSQAQIYEQMQRNYGPQINANPNTIQLITPSPKNKQFTKPIGVLSVTFLELMAQNTFQFINSQNYLQNKSILLNYTNFLYNQDNITGKININYMINSQQKNSRQVYRKQFSHPDPYDSIPRQNSTTLHQKKYINHTNPQGKMQPYENDTSNISTSKNTNQFRLKNTLIDRYNQNISLLSKDNSRLRDLRSQSGMTKKVTPRRKKSKPNKIQSTQKSQQSRLVDPLEILKRRGPKPLRLEEKTKSHSHSYHVRVNRPFQTPMNKRVGNQFDSLNSSQSLYFQRQQTNDHNIPKKNLVSSSNNTQLQKLNWYLQTPQLLQPQFISPKLDKSSQIRRKKNTQQLKNNHVESRIYPTQQTRLSQNRRYDGGNIKFGKSSRFNSWESPQIVSKLEKSDFPGPGHYEVKSMFDRHLVKEP